MEEDHSPGSFKWRRQGSQSQRKTWPAQTRVSTPMFTLKEMAAMVDRLVDKRYPPVEVEELGPPLELDAASYWAQMDGMKEQMDEYDHQCAVVHAKNFCFPNDKKPYPEPPRCKVLVRPEPYVFGNWRTVGITTLTVIDLCEELGMPVHVMQGSTKIHKFRPQGLGPQCQQEQQLLSLHQHLVGSRLHLRRHH